MSSWPNGVNIQFQGLLEKFVNGILRGYRIDIYQNDLHSQTHMRFHNVHGEDVVSFTTDLSCSNAYVVSVRAFTVKGSSSESSSILILKDEEGKITVKMYKKERKKIILTRPCSSDPFIYSFYKQIHIFF